MALSAELADRSTCLVETIGRSSGVPRQIEMWFAADPMRDRIYMLSGGGDRAHWVRNMRADARVRVRIGDRWFDGRAAVIEGGVDDQLARELLAGKYQGWVEGSGMSGWARTALPVAVEIIT